MYQIAIDIYVCLHTLYKHIYLYIYNYTICLQVYGICITCISTYLLYHDIHRPLPSLGLCLGGAVPGIIAGVQH